MPADPRSGRPLDRIPVDLAEICRILTKVEAGARGRALIDDLRSTVSGTPLEIVRQALFADCLRIIHSAVMADGVIEDREIEALYEIIAAAARYYAAGLPSQYGEFIAVDNDAARAFLDRYAADRGAFGRGARLRWLGLILCRRAAELGERGALDRYTAAMTSMITELRRISDVPDAALGPRGTAQELDELRRQLASDATAAAGMDRRLAAFLAPSRVFSAVQQASSIFENDPFDVEDVHREAHTSFQQLIANATMRPQSPDLGRMLVVLGDSGAGKTHLLRGFRRHVQEQNRGFIVYAQLQSKSEDYSRYLLFHLVDSLSKRYSEQSGKTGLREFASGLLRLARPPLRERLQRLADDTWDGRGNLADHVNELVGELLSIPELGSFNVDLLRVLVYALRPDPKTTSSVYKYLHCDPMNAHDRRWIGDVDPRTREDDPHWMLRDLARFAAATGRALVVMVDQVDLAGFEADSTKIFRRAIDALYWLVSECPSAVAVIACLSDLYTAARSELNRPAIDRLERSPPIATLRINRSYAEIKAVVARRLSWLFAEHGTVHRPEQPVYPIPEDELKSQDNRRLRDVLEWCHQFQMQCAAAGKIINADESVNVKPIDRQVDLDAIATAWSEALQASDLELPDEEDEILGAVGDAAKAYVHELGLSLAAPPHKNGVLRLRMSRGDDHAALVVAVTNQNFRGGGFTKGLDSLRRRARGAVPIAVRTLEFPRGPACDKAMGQLINVRGRGAFLDAATLRALVAFQRFHPPFAADRIEAWKLRDRPISSLPAVVEIFDFDRSLVDPSSGSGRRAVTMTGETDAIDAGDSADAIPNDIDPPADPSGRRGAGASGPEIRPPVDDGPGAVPVAVPAETTPRPSKSGERTAARQTSVGPGQVSIGKSTSFEAEPVLLDTVALLRHVAIVDSGGNGRLVGALSLVEQCLERGVPAIAIDRTGEMCGYARSDWWQRSDNPRRASQLAERLDVRLFTPGILGGRPLSAAVVPDLSRVAPAEHDAVIRRAAEAVAAMLRGRAIGDAVARLTVLTQAIGVLARRSTSAGLTELIALLGAGDDDASVPAGDDEVRQRLAEDLSALLASAEVFTAGAEVLTAATLIGGSPGGRVPLAVIHTGFLGEGARLQAWFAQFVGSVCREIGSAATAALGTVLAIDGADAFLPVSAGRTAPREPLQDLIEQTSKACLGVVLSSQRPMELDYRRCSSIGTWLIGKTDEPTLEKMKPLFERHPLGHRQPARLEPGRFVMLRDRAARDVERAGSLLRIEAIDDAELKLLAAQTRPRARVAGQGRSAEPGDDRPLRGTPRGHASDPV